MENESDVRLLEALIRILRDGSTLNISWKVLNLINKILDKLDRNIK